MEKPDYKKTRRRNKIALNLDTHLHHHFVRATRTRNDAKSGQHCAARARRNLRRQDTSASHSHIRGAWRIFGHEGAQLRQNIGGAADVVRAALWPPLLVVKILDQGRPAPGDATLDGSQRRFADLRGIRIGKTAGADQDQCFTLDVGQGMQRARGVGKLQ